MPAECYHNIYLHYFYYRISLCVQEETYKNNRINQEAFNQILNHPLTFNGYISPNISNRIHSLISKSRNCAPLQDTCVLDNNDCAGTRATYSTLQNMTYLVTPVVTGMALRPCPRISNLFNY